jgi:hypothetical protein
MVCIIAAASRGRPSMSSQYPHLDRPSHPRTLAPLDLWLCVLPLACILAHIAARSALPDMFSHTLHGRRLVVVVALPWSALPQSLLAWLMLYSGRLSLRPPSGECYLLHSFGAASQRCLGRLRRPPACCSFARRLTLLAADLTLSAVALQWLCSCSPAEQGP